MALITKIPYVFQTILKKAGQAGVTGQSKKAKQWFRATAQTTMVNPKRMLDTAGPFERMAMLSPNSIGKMYCFFYDPKHKETLPYYDRFPLVFPIAFYSDGFLGINLHYLSPIMRAQLMDALYATINNTKYDNTTKLRISYEILNGATRFSAFKPCVKRYLFSHVRSPFLYIKPVNWDMAMMLPSERFAKANKTRVFRDSAGKI